jgi:hypothetical protein
LCIRIGINQKQCACVCGYIIGWATMHIHQRDCKYLKQFNNKLLHHELPTSSHDTPTVCCYDSTTNVETNININELKHIQKVQMKDTKRNSYYNLYKPFQDYFKVYIPLQGEMYNVVVKKQMYEFDNFTTCNWESIKSIVDSPEENNCKATRIFNNN